MRISTALRLLALGLLAGSLSAPPLSAQPLPQEAKKKPNCAISYECKGYGTTETAAKQDALANACRWLKENSGLDWIPDPEYLRKYNLVRFWETEDKKLVVFDEPMGDMKVVKMQLEIPDTLLPDINKQAQQQRMKERQKYSLLALIGAMALLGVVGGYLRLEEATKGYYTRLLKIAAICFFVVIVAGLVCVVG